MLNKYLQFLILSLFSLIIEVTLAQQTIFPLNLKLITSSITQVSGSLSPYLTTSQTGTTSLNWLEPTQTGFAIKFKLYDGSWGKERTIAKGDNWFINWADFPSLLHIGEDNFVAHWLVKSSADRYAYDVYVAHSKNNGDDWSQPQLINKDKTPTEHGFVSLYEDNNSVGLIYLDGRKMINTMSEDPNDTGMSLRSVNINDQQIITSSNLIDGLVCECCQTDIAIGSDGPIGIYRNRSENEIRDIYITRKIDNKWTEGNPIHNDNWVIAGCPVNGPSIYAKDDDVTIGWFTGANNQPMIKIKKSNDSGKTFTNPISIGKDEAIGHINLTMDENLNTWIVWQKKISDGAAALMLSMLEHNTNRLYELTVDASGNIPRYSVPQITIHKNKVIMAWTTKISPRENARGKNNETLIKVAFFDSTNI